MKLAGIYEAVVNDPDLGVIIRATYESGETSLGTMSPKQAEGFNELMAWSGISLDDMAPGVGDQK